MADTVIVLSSDNVQSGSSPKWDSNGDLPVNTIQCARGVKAYGYAWFGANSQTANFTVNETYGVVDSNPAVFYSISTALGDVTAALLAVGSASNANRAKFLTVTKNTSDANRVLIDPASTELLGGAQVVALYRQGDSATFYADAATGSWQLIGPRPPHIFSAIVASTALTATASETTFDNGSFTLPANTLKAGDILEIEGQGIATAHNASDTLTVKLYIGSNAILTTGAVNYTANDIFTFTSRIVVRDIGATGHVVATGTQILGNEGTAPKNYKLASTSVDTTASITIACKGQMSSNSGSNSARLDIFNCRRAN